MSGWGEDRGDDKGGVELDRERRRDKWEERKEKREIGKERNGGRERVTCNTMP